MVFSVKSDVEHGRKSSNTLTRHFGLKVGRKGMSLIAMGEAIEGKCWGAECGDQTLRFEYFNLETSTELVPLYLWGSNTGFYFQLIMD